MTDTTVPTETWKQLGGDRFAVMTGAKNLIALDDDTLAFQLPARCNGARWAKNGANRVTIKLDHQTDTYVVSFWRVGLTRRALHKATLISEHRDIYCDALRECFERETGLATSLNLRRG